mmetsp:Transcript_4801/g.13841  ORF Transcript_4801/g.13841 Transcript_4801/m.13841 type:complete len:285 (-) Transcript_4801:964-1818(-)
MGLDARGCRAVTLFILFLAIPGEFAAEGAVGDVAELIVLRVGGGGGGGGGGANFGVGLLEMLPAAVTTSLSSSLQSSTDVSVFCCCRVLSLSSLEESSSPLLQSWYSSEASVALVSIFRCLLGPLLAGCCVMSGFFKAFFFGLIGVILAGTSALLLAVADLCEDFGDDCFRCCCCCCFVFFLTFAFCSLSSSSSCLSSEATEGTEISSSDATYLVANLCCNCSRPMSSNPGYPLFCSKLIMDTIDSPMLSMLVVVVGLFSLSPLEAEDVLSLLSSSLCSMVVVL